MTYLNEKPNPYRKGFLISLASLFCVAVLLVNLSSNIIEMNVSQIKSQTFEKTALSKEERFVPQCQLPYMDPWDPDIRKFDDPNYKPPCKKTGKQLTQLTDGKVVLDKEFKGRCQARCLWPVNDKNYKPDIWKDVKDFIAKCDVVEVHCTSEGSNKAKYQFIHSQIVERKDDTNYAAHPTNLKELAGRKTTSHFERPNVYIIAFDSTSSPQFIRSMFRTYYLMKERHEAVVFPHVNKVGENTRPNGWALMLGKQIYDIMDNPYSKPILADIPSNKSCYTDADPEDWWGHRFRDMGYHSMVAEDWVPAALGWPDCTGFARPSAKHVMYPFQQLYNQDNATKTRETFKSICRETYEDIASYWDQFMKTYKNESQFVFLWNVNLAHNRIDGLYHADEPYYRLLESHEKRLENAFVFILGDHGLRHGKVRKTKKGELEDFNPFLMVSVPDQYRDSPIMNVLRKNSRNLISHYDTYASLIHLSKMIKGDTLKEEFENPSQEPFKAGHGSSYFRVNMNQPRHCSDLRIPYEYCLCDKSLEKPIAANSTTAKLLADSIVASMQAKIDELKMTHLCSPRTVKYASTVAAKLVSEDKRKIYKVQITTNPGGGVFSGFVEIRDGTALPISNRFSRENTYGKQGDCVVNIEELRPYCYCKNS